MQVKQFLLDTRTYLHHMVRAGNIKEEVLITLQMIADLSYAWEIVDSYTRYMQEGIKRDPALVIKLRATFLKVSYMIDIWHSANLFLFLIVGWGKISNGNLTFFLSYHQH